MKKLTLPAALICSMVLKAQDSLAPVEPMETSFENKDLILLALAAFAVLVAIYFLFRRSKQRRTGR